MPICSIGQWGKILVIVMGFVDTFKLSYSATHHGIVEKLSLNVRSREYRFTRMNCSTLDILFLSEALSEERI
jgi:hypothetical protein